MDGVELPEFPFPLSVTTETVYAVPLVSPVIVHVRVTFPLVEHVAPPGVAVARYPVIVEPFAAAADQVAVTVLSPRVAVTVAGADGAPRTITALDAALAGDVPIAFVAVTVNL